MTLVLIEGYDQMSAAGFLSTKGWATSTSADPQGHAPTASPTGAGRIAGHSLYIQADNWASFNGGSLTLTKSLPAAYTHVILGFALYTDVTPASDQVIVLLRAGSTSTVQIQLLSATGKLRVLNSSGTTIATTTYATTPGTWAYFEFEIVINGASGSVACQVNGTSDFTTTTGNFGSTGVDSLQFQMGIGNVWGHLVGFYIDDLYVSNAASSPNNTFLGDVAVETIFPNGVGAHTQWTPDSGSNYARVNEHTSGTYPDGDTSYVADKVVNDRDSYTMSDLAVLAGTIYGVQTFMYARKDNPGTRQIAPVLRPVATDRDGTTVTLGTSYGYFTEIKETNPDTSVAWTQSDVNACEIGVKMVA